MSPSYRFAWKTALIVPVVVALALFAASIHGAPRAEALDAEESSFLGIINDYRAQNGVGPLAIDENLNNVARWMANDMAANNYFSHTDSLGRDPFVRMDQLGYAYNTWRGENLVAGTDTATWAMQMWTGSVPHSENMLNPNYTVIGIARAYDASSDFGWYWATEFGGMGGPPPAPPAPAPQPDPTQAPYVPPAPAPAPEPEPVTPDPTQTPAEPPPPPAPTLTPAPQTPSATVFPDRAVTTGNRASKADEDDAWWHVVKALETSWTVQSGVEPSSESFVRQVLR